jgi:hypothetical protein
LNGKDSQANRAQNSSSVDHNKSEQQQSKHKPTERQIAPRPIDMTQEDCITIIFHGLLSPDFHFKPKEQKVTIRAGLDELGLWDWNCTEDFKVTG